MTTGFVSLYLLMLHKWKTVLPTCLCPQRDIKLHNDLSSKSIFRSTLSDTARAAGMHLFAVKNDFGLQNQTILLHLLDKVVQLQIIL